MLDYGKINANDIPSIIESKDRKRAGKTLPPHGLYLVEVRYWHFGDSLPKCQYFCLHNIAKILEIISNCDIIP